MFLQTKSNAAFKFKLLYLKFNVSLEKKLILWLFCAAFGNNGMYVWMHCLMDDTLYPVLFLFVPKDEISLQ